MQDMIFKDRSDAGKRLAAALQEFADQKDTLVIALPRGGVVVGYEIAQALHLPLEIVCPRKISAPFNPELAIGAITETGEGILHHQLIQELNISEAYLQTAQKREQKEALRRQELYHKNLKPKDLSNKRLLVVDDGLATGATMEAAICSLRKSGAKEIILAVPVAPSTTLQRLTPQVDGIICLSTPSPFYGVGQFYTHFEQVTDEEVIHYLAL